MVENCWRILSESPDDGYQMDFANWKGCFAMSALR